MSTQKPADRAAAARWIDQRVGSHRLVRLLGEGGMGMVFEGTHEGVAGRAAIKILRSDVASRPEVVARFFNALRVGVYRREISPWRLPGKFGKGVGNTQPRGG